MTPETWNRIVEAIAAAGRAVQRTALEIRLWASIGSETVTSFRNARVEPWRLVFAIGIIVIPMLILSALPWAVPVAILVAILLALILLATYAADWVGGLTATLTGLVALDLLFVGATGTFDFRSDSTTLWLIITYLAAAAALVIMTEHLKHELAFAKIEASALRAANTAFYSVEIAAAQRPAGDSEAFVGVLQEILTAMARVNRASAGAIYLVDGPNRSLVRAATYGLDIDDETESESPDDSSRIIPIDFGFVGRVASERRPVVIAEITNTDDAPDVIATNPHVKSVVGVPIFDGQNALAGVAWVGLYVKYRFTQTSQARLQALAYRTIAFMEAARMADQQVEELGRVQDSHRRLQAVIQTMPEAVMVVRPPHGQIVTSNAAAQKLFGLTGPGAQLNVRRIDQLSITPDPPELDIELPMMQAMTDGLTVTSVELIVHTPDGLEVPVVASAAPLITEDNEIDAVVGVFQDVSPLKEAERLRDEFISVVSHELRSPLTPIRGFAQVISRDLTREGGHDQHIKWLQTLELHTDRLTRLVDDLLDVSRMRAGRLSVLHEDVDMVEIASAVVESRRTSQNSHEVVLKTDLKELPARGDQDRLMQVLDNLVGNAIKYTDGGKVEVGLSADDEHITFAISDEGRGIPERDREALFSAFYRTRDANESAVPGLGLGLYIVRELVMAHDGEIFIDDSPSGGARFNIILPRNSGEIAEA